MMPSSISCPNFFCLAGILWGKNVVTPYGTFRLDLSERLQIEETPRPA